MTAAPLHTPLHPVRFVTAASLFDGHDAAINIMRRILQSMGAEVIHLGHNRSVDEVVTAALQEDVQGIAISSYQGGHVEYFKYLRDLLDEKGASHVKIFGGGGGVIVPAEIAELVFKQMQAAERGARDQRVEARGEAPGIRRVTRHGPPIDRQRSSMRPSAVARRRTRSRSRSAS